MLSGRVPLFVLLPGQAGRIAKNACVLSRSASIEPGKEIDNQLAAAASEIRRTGPMND